MLHLAAGSHRGGKLSIITRCTEFYPFLHTHTHMFEDSTTNLTLPVTGECLFSNSSPPNIMFQTHALEWLNPCVIGCSSNAHTFRLGRRKGTAADWMCMTTAADHTRTRTRRRKGTSGNMLVHGGTHPGCMATTSTKRVPQANAGEP